MGTILKHLTFSEADLKNIKRVKIRENCLSDNEAVRRALTIAAHAGGLK